MYITICMYDHTSFACHVMPFLVLTMCIKMMFRYRHFLFMLFCHFVREANEIWCLVQVILRFLVIQISPKITE